MSLTQKEEIEAINRRLNSIEGGMEILQFDYKAIRADFVEVRTEHKAMSKDIYVGNGEPAIREGVRDWRAWRKDNAMLPEDVRTIGRWVQNVNKLGWAILIVLIGIFVTNFWNVFIAP